ncbi:hypothetical protein HG537_0D05970 [Torulaspora globosa]|uniref:Uncharacterized protein n=1 Tax=Torulaspora globosa TaxID=48254 RepID=A0A7H9HU41_9SACH|nr:hypothetical protein HG537_0D05970 [Torulaspora sp. CBS 2947]
MSSETLQKILVLLKDDLSPERIRAIRDQVSKQKSTLDYQLDKESSKYFKHVEESLSLLNLSQRSVKNTERRLHEVDELSRRSKSAISRYDIIFNATKLYETIDMTSSIYDRISEFNEVTNRIGEMLEQELSDDALESGCPNLLHIHYMLTMARDFQDQMLVMAQVSTDDVQRTMLKLFSQMTGLIAKFDQLLESLIYDLVEIVRCEQVSLAIRLFKVITVEEKEDLKINAIRNIIKKKEIEQERSSIRKLPSSRTDSQPNIIEYPTSKGLYDEILSGTINTRTQARGYRNFFFNKIKQSVQEMFVEVRKEYQGEKRFEVINNLDWVFNELLIVKEHLTKYCPGHWDIFGKYFACYYDELNSLVNELVESEPETLIILDILDYDKHFQNTLIQDFGFDKKNKKSVIGDKQREQLFADYLSLILVKMTEWIGNLEKAEFDVFLERKTPPHVDSEGLLYLDGTRTCFQMFTQQAEVAAGSGQAKILVGVIERFCDLLKQRQKKWMQKIEIDVRKLLRFNQRIDSQNVEEIEECPGGLVEYIVAVANDQMKAADYSVAISSKYGKLVSKVHERTITQEIEEALDGFAEVAKFCSSELIKIIFTDLSAPFSEIFSKSWYGGNQAQQIADTLYEYMIEIKNQMNPVVFASLLETVVEETILQFIGALKYEHSFKNKNDKFLDSTKRDFETFYKIFIQLLPESEDKTLIIDDKFKLMEYFMDFSCGPIESIPATWTNCLTVYWDTPVKLLSAILKCRKDIDSSDTKKLLQTATRLATDPTRLAKLNEIEAQPTFISRVTALI